MAVLGTPSDSLTSKNMQLGKTKVVLVSLHSWKHKLNKFVDYNVFIRRVCLCLFVCVRV